MTGGNGDVDDHGGGNGDAGDVDDDAGTGNSGGGS